MDSGVEWTEGFDKGLLAARIEAGAVVPNFEVHVLGCREEMMYDMLVVCLRAGMKFENPKMRAMGELCSDNGLPELMMPLLAVAYEHGCRKPDIRHISKYFALVQDAGLRDIRYPVDAGAAKGMTMDRDFVAANFDLRGFDVMCVFLTHMDVPFEYVETRCPCPDYRTPMFLAGVQKERNRFAMLKAVLRSVSRSRWAEYAGIVTSFWKPKYRDLAIRLIPALESEMVVMVAAFRKFFDGMALTGRDVRRRGNQRRGPTEVPTHLWRNILDRVASSNPDIAYLKQA